MNLENRAGGSAMLETAYNLLQFYGQTVGTPGISEEIRELCNNQILRIHMAVKPELDKVIAEFSGIKL